jgi:hypothetical protein
MAVRPDFSSEVPLRWVHRRDRTIDIYFVVNPEGRVVETTAVFRASGRRPELWDPVTGEAQELAGFAEESGLTSVRLRFEPHQSFFVVFRDAPSPAVSKTSGAPGGGLPQPDEVATLAGPWEVSFDPKWGGPERIVFDRLEDWSQRAEDGIKYYSGTAVYWKTFDLILPAPAESARLWLDLGTVRNIASVRLNGSGLLGPVRVLVAPLWKLAAALTIRPLSCD